MKKIDCNIIILVLIGIIARVIHIIEYPVPNRDTFKYSEFISLWETHKTIPTIASYPPLSLYVFKTTHEVLGLSIVNCCIIANMVFCILTIIAVYYITKEIIHSRLLSFIITLIFSTHPFLVEYSCQGSREMIYMFFSVLALYSIYRSIYYNKTIDVVCAAAFCTLGFMTRHEGLELYAIFIMLSFIAGWKKISIAIRKTILLIVVSACVFVAMSWFMNVSVEYYDNYIDEYNRIFIAK